MYKKIALFLGSIHFLQNIEHLNMESCNEIEAVKFKLELFWQIYNEVMDHL